MVLHLPLKLFPHLLIVLVIQQAALLRAILNLWAYRLDLVPFLWAAGLLVLSLIVLMINVFKRAFTFLVKVYCQLFDWRCIGAVHGCFRFVLSYLKMIICVLGGGGCPRPSQQIVWLLLILLREHFRDRETHAGPVMAAIILSILLFRGFNCIHVCLKLLVLLQLILVHPLDWFIA